MVKIYVALLVSGDDLGRRIISEGEIERKSVKVRAAL